MPFYIVTFVSTIWKNEKKCIQFDPWSKMCVRLEEIVLRMVCIGIWGSLRAGKRNNCAMSVRMQPHRSLWETEQMKISSIFSGFAHHFYPNLIAPTIFDNFAVFERTFSALFSPEFHFSFVNSSIWCELNYTLTRPNYFVYNSRTWHSG